ncbi:MFS transporter [Demequina oxidasica]|uniref:MFS transporter n=1 Tax=Demequina oxidasica TaxID=676199 RepID=UPI000AADC892|nr:MFS transporter [Demequina oxidasica]
MSLPRDLRTLWHSRGFRRLTYTRALSQAGDGMFQVGIATAFFFDPTQAATARDIAIGFIVLLAPFTLVGPFVGPLIDRWQRQRILLVGNLVRLALVVAICAVLLVDADGSKWALYTLALLALSVNRFLNAAMTAGIPKVVEPHELLAANSIMPTLGTIASAIGAAAGGIATIIAPSATDANLALAALAGSTIGFAGAAWVVTGLGRRELGPDHPLESLHLVQQVRSLGHELRGGVKYLHARVTPFQGLGVMAAQRLLYGVMFVAAILISRNVLGDPDHPEQAIQKFTLVLGFAAVGFFAAAVITPSIVDRMAPQQWIVLSLIIGAVGQAVFAISSEPWTLFTATIVVSYAVQAAKIAVDTIVQRDTDDAVRGRAFTLYDMAFNVAFILAAVVGAMVLPDSGYSRPVIFVLVASYLAVAALYSRAPREPMPAPVPAQSTKSLTN